MEGRSIRKKRVNADIPAALLAARAGIDRARLSAIERGYVEPTAAEQAALVATLDRLIAAREQVLAVAEEVGWPL